MEGLRKYGGAVNGVFQSSGDDENYTYEWELPQITISQKYYNEIISMRDEYQDMFEEYFKKFQTSEVEKEKLQDFCDEKDKHIFTLQNAINVNATNDVEQRRLDIVPVDVVPVEGLGDNAQVNLYDTSCDYSVVENLLECILERSKYFEGKFKHLEKINKGLKKELKAFNNSKSILQDQVKEHQMLLEKGKIDNLTVVKEMEDRLKESEEERDFFKAKMEFADKSVAAISEQVNLLEQHIISRKYLPTFLRRGFKLTSVTKIKDELVLLDVLKNVSCALLLDVFSPLFKEKEKPGNGFVTTEANKIIPS